VAATGRPHLLQSRAWADAKALTGWSPLRFRIGDGGAAQVLLKELPLGVVVAYAPRGPLVADDALPDAIAGLRDALGARRCAAFLCDPEVRESDALRSALGTARIRSAPIYVQPRRTLLMDLATDPDALLAAMKKKHRQYIRKAERAGVVIEPTDDLERFQRVMRIVGERDRFAIHHVTYYERLRGSLGDRLHVLMARVGGDDAGALMLARMADRAWELYGGWSGTHAEERPFYLLKWTAMLRMRALGVRRYDMWGLSDSPGGPDPLAGVENFKLGFGGETVTWVGALETAVTPWLFPLWRTLGRRRLARAAA
jgi:lipid II:glycine glycyltransferase (peptidoglycan interpeptide bridge formation enzyme)